MKKKPLKKTKQKKHMTTHKQASPSQKNKKLKLKKKAVIKKSIKNTSKKITPKKAKAKPKPHATKKPGNKIVLKKQKKKLKNLISKGKDQGYLTLTEVNDHLPSEIIDSNQIEDIIDMLNEDMGIPICNEASEANSILLNENSAITIEERQTTSSVTIATEDETGRTSDPVRMYMREMGTVELLTRGGEVTIAKKIETGSKHVLSALARYPGVIASILAEYAKTETSEKHIQDIISGFYDIEEWHTPASTDKQTITNIETITKQNTITSIKGNNIGIKEKTIEETDSNQDDTTASEDDELDLFESGPDPVIAKERFTKLHTLNRQYVKASGQHKKTPKAIAKLHQQLIDTFTQFKLTPKEFYKQTLKLKKVFTDIRKNELAIFNICVKQSKVARKVFINAFLQHESDLKWIDEFAKANTRIR